MKKYKIKLQAGDYVASFGVSLKQYEELGNRFIDDGCARCEFPAVGCPEGYPKQDFFGWANNCGGLFHGNKNPFKGRLLTYSEIMELDEKEIDHGEVRMKPAAHENIEWCGKRGGFWVKSRVVDCTAEQICLLHHSDQKYKPHKMEVFYFNDINIRPIKSGREKAIEKAVEHLPFVGINEDSANEFLGKLYDAGLLKLPKEKTPSDFKANLISLIKDHGVDFRAESREKHPICDDDYNYFFCAGNDLLFSDADLAEELYEIEKREKESK